MKTVAGIFTSQAAAERAVERLRSKNIAHEHINFLTPGTPRARLETVPTTETEQPGMGKAVGGLVGGAVGISGGALGLAAASAFIPGVGPVIAIGLAAEALLGVAGAVVGAAVGGTVENALSQGLPKDEIFVYEDALRQGRTVLIILTEDETQADAAREVLAQAGAESIDAAREQWWLGLRDAEAEVYTAHGFDFTQDEAAYRQGFEAALHLETAGKAYEEVRGYLQTHYPDTYDGEAFRRGYARGLAYHEGLREKYHH
jgi:hypothetical protein